MLYDNGITVLFSKWVIFSVYTEHKNHYKAIKTEILTKWNFNFMTRRILFVNGKTLLCLINHTPRHKNKWSGGSQARATAPLAKEPMVSTYLNVVWSPDSVFMMRGWENLCHYRQKIPISPITKSMFHSQH